MNKYTYNPSPQDSSSKLGALIIAVLLVICFGGCGIFIDYYIKKTATKNALQEVMEAK